MPHCAFLIAICLSRSGSQRRIPDDRRDTCIDSHREASLTRESRLLLALRPVTLPYE
jgi:hypothetical protein